MSIPSSILKRRAKPVYDGLSKVADVPWNTIHRVSYLLNAGALIMSLFLFQWIKLYCDDVHALSYASTHSFSVLADVSWKLVKWAKCIADLFIVASCVAVAIEVSTLKKTERKAKASGNDSNGLPAKRRRVDEAQNLIFNDKPLSIAYVHGLASRLRGTAWEACNFLEAEERHMKQAKYTPDDQRAPTASVEKVSEHERSRVTSSRTYTEKSGKHDSSYKAEASNMPTTSKKNDASEEEAHRYTASSSNPTNEKNSNETVAKIADGSLRASQQEPSIQGVPASGGQSGISIKGDLKNTRVQSRTSKPVSKAEQTSHEANSPQLKELQGSSGDAQEGLSMPARPSNISRPRLQFGQYDALNSETECP